MLPFYLVSIKYFDKNHTNTNICFHLCSNLKNMIQFSKQYFQKNNIDINEYNSSVKKLKEFTDMHEKVIKLKQDIKLYIPKARKVHPRFHFLPDNIILNLLTCHYSIAESKRVFQECFPGLNDIKLYEEDDVLGIFSYTNLYNEELFPN